MLNVSPIPAFNDNYFWLLSQDSSPDAVVVDPGAAQPVLDYLNAHGLQLVAILLTHHHWDHTNGVEELRKIYQAKVYGPKSEHIDGLDVILTDGDSVELDELGCRFSVLSTPGHTLDHISYYGDSRLFCGDTLFAGGCGRLFEGTPAMMRESLSKLADLPAETQVFCAHEYTLANLKFARTLEPNNPVLEQRYQQVSSARERNEITLPSTISAELATNPFLRCHSEEIKSSAETHSGRDLPQVNDVFAEIRSMKDAF